MGWRVVIIKEPLLVRSGNMLALAFFWRWVGGRRKVSYGFPLLISAMVPNTVPTYTFKPLIFTILISLRQQSRNQAQIFTTSSKARVCIAQSLLRSSLRQISEEFVDPTFRHRKYELPLLGK